MSAPLVRGARAQYCTTVGVGGMPALLGLGGGRVEPAILHLGARWCMIRGYIQCSGGLSDGLCCSFHMCCFHAERLQSIAQRACCFALDKHVRCTPAFLY